MSAVEGWKVTLPLVHNLIMKIYHIILSPQHKHCSMSVTACQVGLRKMTPTADETAMAAVCSKCADSGHRAPYGRAGWRSRGCKSLFVWIGVYLFASVCTFLRVKWWPAAALESLLTESVGSAGYFYPLACVREQVEALWDWNKVTWWRLPLCDYLRRLWPNVKVCECPPSTKTQQVTLARLQRLNEELISTTQHSPGKRTTQVNPVKG